MVQGADYPIVAHTDVDKGADCCGCLYLDERGRETDIICNECGEVLYTVPTQQGLAAIAGMVTGEICSAICTHCGALNMFPGWSSIEAFICSRCEKGVLPLKMVQ